MALIATAGATNADSYVTLLEAETYWVNHGNPSDWDTASTPELESALRYATQYLEQNFTWYSTIYDVSQSLSWPRRPYWDSQGRPVAGDGVIPWQVKDAVCELALEYLKDDFTSSDTENIQSETIGAASVTYATGSKKTYPYMRMMLRDFGSANKSGNGILLRG